MKNDETKPRHEPLMMTVRYYEPGNDEEAHDPKVFDLMRPRREGKPSMKDLVWNDLFWAMKNGLEVEMSVEDGDTE